MDNFLLTEHTASSNLKSPSFSGHQTFPFRYTWLKKGVDAVRKDKTVFSSENASVDLGVGKNMVTSIRHWCQVSGLIRIDPHQRGRYKPTDFGKIIFDDQTGFDPYLDDPATLWLIHWKIATNINQATSWYWAFNVFRENKFSFDAFKQELRGWIHQQKPGMRTISDNTFQRDIQCFIRTYCQSRHTSTVIEDSFDCPLVELNLITESPDSAEYEFQRGEKMTLPVEVFAAVLVAFWDDHFAKKQSLSFSELMYEQLSPGRIFRLDADTMTMYLETLNKLTDGALEYGETTGLRQVYRYRDLDSTELLKQYYG